MTQITDTPYDSISDDCECVEDLKITNNIGCALFILATALFTALAILITHLILK